jgi:TPP-dependent 2-oxoacid decarboxylase
MGFGLPAAIGAQLADRNATVVAILGDGGFHPLISLSERIKLSRPHLVLADIRRHNRLSVCELVP